MQVCSLGCGDPLEEKMTPTPVFLPTHSATPRTIVHQAPSVHGFSRQEYWGGLPFPSPGDIPDPEIEPRPPALQADSLPSEL